MPAPKTIPAAAINNVGRLAEEARAELAHTATDEHLSVAVARLATAIEQIAEMLDYHQEFLIALRNEKADAR